MNTHLRRRYHGRKQFLDLAPMVDVTLTLVVFLLLSSESIDVRQVPVQLPQAASAEVETKSVTIQIQENGDLIFNGQSCSIEELLQRIGKPERVSIYADEQSRHGRVTYVVDRLRGAGIEHIFYGVEAVDTW